MGEYGILIEFYGDFFGDLPEQIWDGHWELLFGDLR